MSDRELLALADQNFTESLREHARWACAELLESGGGVLSRGASDFPSGPFNALARSHHELGASALLDAAHAYFAQANRRFSVYARRHADADLAAECAARRYRELGQLSVMVLTEKPSWNQAPAGTRLVRVASCEQLKAFVEVASESFETLALPREAVNTTFADSARLQAPGLYLLLAEKDGKPVSCALALRQREVAGIYWVGTVPSARGQGIATSCVAELARVAFAAGSRCVVLQAVRPARSTYERLGFREVSELACFAAPKRATKAHAVG